MRWRQVFPDRTPHTDKPWDRRFVNGFESSLIDGAEDDPLDQVRFHNPRFDTV